MKLEKKQIERNDFKKYGEIFFKKKKKKSK